MPCLLSELHVHVRVRVAQTEGEGGHLIELFLFTDDEAETERRKVDCLDDMQFLEQQFSDLKEL